MSITVLFDTVFVPDLTSDELVTVFILFTTGLSPCFEQPVRIKDISKLEIKYF